MQKPTTKNKEWIYSTMSCCFLSVMNKWILLGSWRWAVLPYSNSSRSMALDTLLLLSPSHTFSDKHFLTHARTHTPKSSAERTEPRLSHSHGTQGRSLRRWRHFVQIGRQTVMFSPNTNRSDPQTLAPLVDPLWTRCRLLMKGIKALN